ncbi:MAG: DUF2277 domain-containing protein [Actinomycetes bacterium]
MCRSIVRLREGAQIAGHEEIEAAARQFVRKVSGFSKPAPHNEAVFEQAIAEITEAVERLMQGLVIRGASN